MNSKNSSGYIYCISYNIPQEERKKYGRYNEIMGVSGNDEYMRYYIGASNSLPFYMLIKRNNDLIYPSAPPHLRLSHYKCLFAKFVKDLANEKAKLDELLHTKCIAIMNTEQKKMLHPEHKKGAFVEMENTEDYKWHRPWSDHGFLPSMISLEYIISLFDLSIGDYIDIEIDNITDSAKEYEEYVICERIEEAFRMLDNAAKAANKAEAAVKLQSESL